jgi:hypothetical protein
MGPRQERQLVIQAVVDGRVAAAGPHAGHPPLRPRLSVYVGRVTTVPGGPPHYL